MNEQFAKEYVEGSWLIKSFKRGYNPAFLWYNYFEYILPMDREKLKLIVRNLKSLVEILESEVHSDPAAYVDKRENFDDEYYPLADYDEVFEDDDD